MSGKFKYLEDVDKNEKVKGLFADTKSLQIMFQQAKQSLDEFSQQTKSKTFTASEAARAKTQLKDY